jgi:uncharacterized protein (TIGR00255 family)
MTGFARAESQHPWGDLACEIRSVNHRYLETHFRIPESLRGLENNFRTQLKAKLSRGKVEASIFLKMEDGGESELSFNETLATQISQMAEKITANLDNPAPINPLEVLRWPGVLQTAEVDKSDIEEAVLSLFDNALSTLVANREREGEELKNFILQRLEDINTHTAAVRSRLSEIVEAHQTKLIEKIESLKLEVDEERLTQEMVYYAQRADVAEELDRLEAHINEVTLALKQQKPIGRRLDFLMQELNREANTLSSKSVASDTTQNAVDLKVLIEQMREQIQNLE